MSPRGLIAANSPEPTPMSAKIVDCLVETVGVIGNLLDGIGLLFIRASSPRASAPIA